MGRRREAKGSWWLHAGADGRYLLTNRTTRTALDVEVRVRGGVHERLRFRAVLPHQSIEVPGRRVVVRAMAPTGSVRRVRLAAGQPDRPSA